MRDCIDQQPVPSHSATTRPHTGGVSRRSGVQRPDGNQQVRARFEAEGRTPDTRAPDERLRLGLQAEGLAKGEIRFSPDDYPLPPGRHIIEDQMIAGVYFLIKDDAVVYVGKSTNIINRVWSHRKSGIDFDTFTYVEVHPKHQDRIEAAYTAALRPHLNCSEDGTPKNPELALHVRYLTSDVDIFA